MSAPTSWLADSYRLLHGEQMAGFVHWITGDWHARAFRSIDSLDLVDLGTFPTSREARAAVDQYFTDDVAGAVERIKPRVMAAVREASPS